MDAFENRKLNIKSILLIAISVILCVAVCVLLFCLNIIEAVALEQEIRCDIEEHIHMDCCYNGDFLICKKPAHSHDGNCYIVLLNQNDINGILTLLSSNETRSLEYVITDTMSSALTFNTNLNTSQSTNADTLTLSQDTVAALNTTISDEETLPDIVLNEKINNISSLAMDDSANNGTNSTQNGTSLYSVGDNPVTANYNANFYIYLDEKWTCIGTLPFTTTSSSSNRYNGTIQTSEILNLVNGALGTDYNYNSFDIAVSTSQNSGYSTSNIGMNSVTTTVAYNQSNSNVRRVRYVRLIPNNGSASSTAFNFFTVKYEYPDGSTTTKYVRSGTTVTLPQGNYEWKVGNTKYTAGQAVTIRSATTFAGTLIGPPTFVNINYNVNFPTVSGVTVSTKPTLAGLTVTTIRDEFTEGSNVAVRNVSQQSVEGKVDGNTTGLSRVIQFKGWRVGNSDIIIQPNTNLIWEELLQYSNNSTTLNLNAVWESEAVRTATFFIRFDSVAVDTEGNVTDQDVNKYTQELFSAYVGGIDTSLSSSRLQSLYGIADTTSDNSYGADQAIRALYGERTEGVWLSALPTDDYIFQSLVKYAETGYLSVDGVPVKAEDLNDRAYAIRWYVFKSQDDAWHIDGKLVKKEGLIHVYKTFAGNKELISAAKANFSIDAKDITAGTNTVLNLQNYKSYDSVNDTYMWEISNVDYGELWEITEHPHIFDDSEIGFSVYSEYTVMDAHGDQSTTGVGTSLTVRGMTYALDEGIDEVLRAEFTNIYNKANSIIIKKQDSLTGVSIGGATFKLLQNGKELKFNYNSETESYLYAPAYGTVTLLEGTANGYFEISVENFSYDLGPITVREVSPPKGYSPIGDVEIGYIDENNTIGILGGNSELIRYVSGILIVGNSTDSSSVTVKKNWDCPETEWQDVTIQLLANDKLVTTVIAGVDSHVILSADNNWQHTWKNLPVYVNGEKIIWSIKEVQIGSETAKADGSFVNWLVSYELPVKSTDEDGNENTLLTVTNTTKRVMLRLTKTNLGKSLQLKGASFLLEAVDKDGNLLPQEIAKTATTGDSGTLIFDNLKSAIRYRLTELTAPEGYIKCDEYIYFTIGEDGSVTVEETYYAEAGTTAYNIIVRNGQIIDLPESGGIGTVMFYALGLLFIVAAIGIYIDTFRKRRCQN